MEYSFCKESKNFIEHGQFVVCVMPQFCVPPFFSIQSLGAFFFLFQSLWQTWSHLPWVLHTTTKKKSLLDSKMFCLFHFVQIYLECINYTRTKKYSPCLCSLCLTKHVQLDLASAICLCEIRSQCPRFSFVLPITCCFFLCSILADFP